MKIKQYKVYVGCALTHASEEFKASVEKLKDKLRDICTVLDFKGLSDENDPKEIYDHDINKCVRRSDLLVAICDEPSIGLGYEMATQQEGRAKPMLAVAHKDSKVSKLILGIPTNQYEFLYYNNLDKDVYDMVVERLGKL